MFGKTEQKVFGKSEQERYSRIPDSVLFDLELTAAARLVYVFLARHVFQGNVASFGQRLIAKKLGLHVCTVNAAIKSLVERKHISVVGKGIARRHYVLHSTVFGQKQRAGVEEVAVGPSGGKRLVSVRTA